MWVCGWDPLILNPYPARFGVHRSYGTGNNGVFCISSNSNSNSNAEVPMPRFRNGQIDCTWKRSRGKHGTKGQGKNFQMKGENKNISFNFYTSFGAS